MAKGASYDEVITIGDKTIHRTVTINQIKKTASFRKELVRNIGEGMSTPLLPKGTFRFIQEQNDTYLIFRYGSIMNKKHNTLEKIFPIWVPNRVYKLSARKSSLSVSELFLIGDNVCAPSFPNYTSSGSHCIGGSKALGSNSAEVVINYLHQQDTGGHVHNNDYGDSIINAATYLKAPNGVVPYFEKLAELTEKKDFTTIETAYSKYTATCNFLADAEMKHIKLLFLGATR